jgi:hypothetical protein
MIVKRIFSRIAQSSTLHKSLVSFGSAITFPQLGATSIAVLVGGKVLSQEVNPLFEEIHIPLRQALDEIVSCSTLGLTNLEAEQICQSAGELSVQRVERFSEKQPAS